MGCEPKAPSVPGRPLQVRFDRHGWGDGTVRGEVLVTDHYRIYTTVRREHLLSRFPGFLEAAYANYLRQTGLAPAANPRKLVVYLMGSKEDWKSVTRRAVGRELHIEAGGYTFRGIGVYWDVGTFSTFSVAAHEGLHQFLYDRLEHPLPMWLDEGLATSCEGYVIDGESVGFTPGHNVKRFGNLRSTLIQGRWIPLRQLLAMTSMEANSGTTSQAVGYYAQVWALVQFIRSDPDSARALEQLIADAAAGKLHEVLGVPARALLELKQNMKAYTRTLGEPVFKHYFAEDIDAFETRYKQYARDLAKL